MSMTPPPRGTASPRIETSATSATEPPRVARYSRGSVAGSDEERAWWQRITTAARHGIVMQIAAFAMILLTLAVAFTFLGSMFAGLGFFAAMAIWLVWSLAFVAVMVLYLMSLRRMASPYPELDRETQRIARTLSGPRVLLKVFVSVAIVGILIYLVLGVGGSLLSLGQSGGAGGSTFGRQLIALLDNIDPVLRPVTLLAFCLAYAQQFALGSRIFGIAHDRTRQRQATYMLYASIGMVVLTLITSVIAILAVNAQRAAFNDTMRQLEIDSQAFRNRGGGPTPTFTPSPQAEYADMLATMMFWSSIATLLLWTVVIVFGIGVIARLAGLNRRMTAHGG